MLDEAKNRTDICTDSSRKIRFACNLRGTDRMFTFANNVWPIL